MKKVLLCSIIAVTLGTACNNSSPDTSADQQADQVTNTAPMALAYSIVNILPHDSTAFTQGLYWYEGKLYEGTGAPEPYRYTSSLRVLDPATGKIEKKLEQGKDFFGEGITIHNNKLYQLTWQNRKVFVYDPQTFKKTAEFDWNGEGWGITSDGEKLLISDGSNNISVTNPETMRVEKIIGVYDNNGPVGRINELEYIDGYLYANQWETDYILKIDLSDGKVVGRADFSGLLARNTKENVQLEKYRQGSAVLNGIAYDSTSKNLYITGKLWPNIFEIKWQ